MTSWIFAVFVRCQNKRLDCNVYDCVTVRREKQCILQQNNLSCSLSFNQTDRRSVASKFSIHGCRNPCMHIPSTTCQCLIMYFDISHANSSQIPLSVKSVYFADMLETPQGSYFLVIQHLSALIGKVYKEAYNTCRNLSIPIHFNGRCLAGVGTPQT